MNVYSNAFNYETYFSGKVDTRTGQFDLAGYRLLTRRVGRAGW